MVTRESAASSAPDCAGRNGAQWTYDAEETSDGCAHSVYDEHGQRLTEPYINEHAARLITAAPALLEALRAIVDDKYVEKLGSLKHRALAAIAKAEGR